jgi:hypothetical protein
MTAFGNHVAMPGNIDRMIIAKTIHITKGNDPIRIFLSEISGAMPFIT